MARPFSELGTKARQGFPDMFHEGAVIAEEHDQQAWGLAEIAQGDEAIFGAGQAEIRSGRAQRQHRRRCHDHAG